MSLRRGLSAPKSDRLHGIRLVQPPQRAPCVRVYQVVVILEGITKEAREQSFEKVDFVGLRPRVVMRRAFGAFVEDIWQNVASALLVADGAEIAGAESRG